MKPKAALFNLWDKHFPVIRAFAERNPDFLILVQHGSIPGIPILKPFAGRIIPYDNLLSQEEREAAIAGADIKARFLAGFQSGPNAGEWLEFCSNIGVSPEGTADTLFKDVGPKLLDQVLQIENMEKLHDKLDIRIVVVNEEYTLLPKSLVVWAKTRGFPVLHINHSLGMSGWYTVNDKMDSDALAVYGPVVADGPMEIALGGNRIFISGNPDWLVYDKYLPFKAEAKREILAQLFRGSRDPLVVFGTTFSAKLTATEGGKDTAASARAFFRALAILKAEGRAVNCVVKLRPNNDPSFEKEYADIAEEQGIRSGEYVFARTGLEKLMLAADAVVSVDSTLSADALIADTLAINLISEEGWRRGPYYPRYSGILESRTEELADCLRDALENKGLQDRLKEMRRRSRKGFQGAQPGTDPASMLAVLIGQMSLADASSPPDPAVPIQAPEEPPWAQVARALNRSPGPIKMSVIIRPPASFSELKTLVFSLSKIQVLPSEIYCLVPPSMAESALRELPAGTVLIQVAGSPHSRAVLGELSRRIQAGFVAFLGANIHLAPAWDELLIPHLAGNAVVAPLVNRVSGTQSIYHYLPTESVDPEAVESVSQEVRMRFPGLALSADWLYDDALAFGKDVLTALSGLPDEIPDNHFLGLGQKLKLAGTRLLVAKDVYACLES